MRKRFGVAMLAVLFIVFGFSFKDASAISSNVVLSQVQLGNAASATNEFVELYNNATTDTEITNWCLYYASATSTQIGNKLGCFTPENDSLHLYLPSYSYAFAVSTVLATNQPSLGNDLRFSATLSGTAGHVRIVDNLGSEIDKVGWGTTALSPETLFTPTASIGKVLQRKTSSTVTILQDTDNNNLDFEIANPRSSYAYGSIYEVQDLCSNIIGTQTSIPPGYSVDAEANCIPPPIDICTNIDGLQVVMPAGYDYDNTGLCKPDVCSNITGLQTSVPGNKVLDAYGNCLDYDYCVNLSGLQSNVPSGYKIINQDTCLLDLLPLTINEILANAIGSDDGNEFIELYNPNDVNVDLSLYLLKVGIDTPKLYTFPAGSILAPKDYASFSNDDVAFTLVNSSSQVSIVSTDNQIIDVALVYSNPEDGMAWGLIADSWQYTNQPTPGSRNEASAITQDDIEEVVSGLKPCAPNQYRNPETNRCRVLVTVGSTLAACKDGQYRSETTNRCRSIASDAGTLTPCDPNQERNPETNRCRLIASTSSNLAECKEGQERNVDTNRCRTVFGSVPTAGFGIEPIADTGSGVIGWWAVGGISIIALAYAVWEWREELLQAIRRLGTFFHSQK